MNLSKVIVGSYFDQNNRTHGFVRDALGAVASFEAPTSSEWILVSGVSTSGVVGGYYADANFVSHGFAREAASPFAITTFDPVGSFGTTVNAVNAAGSMTGYFQDANSTHGFVRTVPVPPAFTVATTKAQCENQGWKTVFRTNGSSFKNQGDCIQFVNTGK